MIPGPTTIPAEGTSCYRHGPLDTVEVVPYTNHGPTPQLNRARCPHCTEWVHTPNGGPWFVPIELHNKKLVHLPQTDRRG